MPRRESDVGESQALCKEEYLSGWLEFPMTHKTIESCEKHCLELYIKIKMEYPSSERAH